MLAPTERVGRAFVGTLALANLAIWTGFFTPIQLLLPQHLEHIAGDDGAPALAAPVVGGLGGYPMLYGLTALVTVAGAVLVLPIRSVR